MKLQFNYLIGVVESALYDKPKPTDEELRRLIQGLAFIAPEMKEDDLERVAREIEFKQGIKAGLGAIVDNEGFEPWLDDAKSDIEPFYWDRYRKLLLKSGLPGSVITDTDMVTDKILGRLGDPRKNVPWDRRGMVVGHVQSGKTANYIGLICKAADAGYRLIIVIAGVHNNLRNQTQARIDEGFIGRDTGKQLDKRAKRKFVGVGKIDPNRTPVSLTNTIRDFNKETASTNTSEIDSYKVPVILVIKKNYRTLGNLLDWLQDNSARGDQNMIDQPMLLIDDEADNASINTKYGKEEVTKINSQIRDLLKRFHRSCYVGYTATPFANIFIDPDQEHDMHAEDLFPRDFIIGLGAPTNYFGPKRVYVDGLQDEDNPVWLRYIYDNESSLPIKHAINHNINALPSSLIRAVRTFLIARTIRNLRGQSASHCSMLVNASRFTAVQGQLRNRLHEALEAIKNAVRINASLGSAALQDPEIAALHETWEQEYIDTETDWWVVQSHLLEAIAAAKVVEVNSRANDLNYADSGEKGQTVIAVGGFSLSRGLTLEGLTVTWFLRNTLMYDTLMQMGRWFGYRDGYEDLCRIWMPEAAIGWYAFIAQAAEELHAELRRMDKAKATPDMFGLAVRSHPASLLVTARNKMGSGQAVTASVGLSNRFVETARVSIKQADLSTNLGLTKKFISQLDESGFLEEKTPWGILIRDVPVTLVDQFLAGWRNAPESVLTETAPIRKYIEVRKSDELPLWDVLIPSLQAGDPDTTLGRPIIPSSRVVDVADLKHGFMSFGGKGMRVASRGIEKAGVDPEKAMDAESQYREKEGGENYPDLIYRAVRDSGLIILHYVRAKKRLNSEDAGASKIPVEPVVAWGLSLPVSKRPSEKVQYVVNAVRYQELFGPEDDDEDGQEEL